MKRLVLIAAFALPLIAAAQPPAPPAPMAPPAPPAPKPMSPEHMQQMMQASMGAMVPAMAQMTSAMVEAQLAAAVKPETAERIAVFKHNLYESLLRKGFTQQQAVEIVLATPLPGAPVGGR